MSNRVPCITRTRGGQFGHYVTNRKRPLTLKEMLRLQGLPEDYEDDASKVGMTPRQLGQCIGNAMSVNILTELLRSMLTAIDRGVCNPSSTIVMALGASLAHAQSHQSRFNVCGA